MTQRASLRAGALLAFVVVAGACPGTRGASRGTRGPPRFGAPVVVVDEQGEPGQQPRPPTQILRAEHTVIVPLEGGPAELGALIVRPHEGERGPFLLIVPGGGDISRNGTRSGDGVALYGKPVDVGLAWAEAFAARGGQVLLWDKRTCGPNDDDACRKNPQDDVDANGPIALAKDVDAACALARAQPSSDGRLVLFAHGQAAQVALSSTCAREASAIVLLAPIPRAIDEVLVDGLKDRTLAVERSARQQQDPAAKQPLLDQAHKLKNLAGTREAEFASMKKDRFAPTARVNGATLAFWRGWMDVTAKTPSLVDAVKETTLVVLGGADLQYSEADRGRIRALSPSGLVEVSGADHHLLTHGTLSPATVDAVGAAIDELLAPGS